MKRHLLLCMALVSAFAPLTGGAADTLETIAPWEAGDRASFKWFVNGKTLIDVGGKQVSVQIGLNLTIVGSKDLPKDAPPG